MLSAVFIFRHIAGLLLFMQFLEISAYMLNNLQDIALGLLSALYFSI